MIEDLRMSLVALKDLGRRQGQAGDDPQPEAAGELAAHRAKLNRVRADRARLRATVPTVVEGFEPTAQELHPYTRQGLYTHEQYVKLGRARNKLFIQSLYRDTVGAIDHGEVEVKKPYQVVPLQDNKSEYRSSFSGRPALSTLSVYAEPPANRSVLRSQCFGHFTMS